MRGARVERDRQCHQGQHVGLRWCFRYGFEFQVVADKNYNTSGHYYQDQCITDHNKVTRRQETIIRRSDSQQRILSRGISLEHSRQVGRAQRSIQDLVAVEEGPLHLSK